MCSIILIICVLIAFVPANGDETPAVVDPKYGKDMYCHFAYFSAVDPSTMKENSQLAQQFGQGQLKRYKIGFTTLTNGAIASTLVEDCNGVVCGMAYLVPVSEFQKMLQKTFDEKKQKVEKLITVTVDVTKDGQKISMDCNTFQELTQPKGDEVPCKQTIDEGIDAYTAGQLSKDCIAKLREFPVKTCIPPP